MNEFARKFLNYTCPFWPQTEVLAMGDIKVEKKKDEKSNAEKKGEGKRSDIVERSDYLPWSWFFDFDDVLRDFRRSFKRWLPTTPGGGDLAFWHQPRLDIRADDGEYVINADLPGINKEDVTLEVREDSLLIKAEAKEEKEEKGKGFIRRERGFRSYYRQVPLPEDALLTEDIDAKLEKGVLEIHVKRQEGETKAPRKVEIK